MHIHSELLYTDNERIIVKVSAWHGNKELGSALGQGETVESAEDKAIMRLNNRINRTQNVVETHFDQQKIEPESIEVSKDRNSVNIKKESNDKG